MKAGLISLFLMAWLLAGCKNAVSDKTTGTTNSAATTISNASNSAANATAAPAKVLNVTEFAASMAKMDKKDYYLIDVRTKEEFEAGALPDALNIDFNGDDFEAQLAKLDKSKTAFIYCQAGGRSASACKVAEKMAFKAVFDMDGGYSAWSEGK